MTKRTTILDIAHQAKVAPSTVSRALNSHNSKISKNTRTRIRKIADGLNYTPNKMARGLATGRTNIIGIIINDLYNPFITELLVEIEARLSAAGYESRILQFHNRIEELEDRISRLIQDHARAILLAPSDLCLNPPQIYQKIINNQNASLPVILVSDRFFTHTKYSVTGDNLRGAKIAVQHLIKLGHEHIALVTGSMSNSSLSDRFEGYKQALQENGFVYDERLVALDVFRQSPSGVFKSIDSLLAMDPFPTALFICSDFMALTVLRYLKGLCLKIPEELSIVGFDNIKLCAHMAEPLTTVEFSKQCIADGVLTILENVFLSEGKLEPVHIKIEPALIIRNSTCPPKKLLFRDKKLFSTVP